MTSHPGPMPAPAAPAPPPSAPNRAELEAQRDRARTELLLEQLADEDLAEHRARVGTSPTLTGHLAGAPW
jgi:hypothetical protein